MTLAQMLVDSDEKQEDEYDSSSINFATGVSLDRLASNYGLMRKQAEQAQVTLSFIGTSGYVIVAGSVFMDDNGNEFYTLADCQLDVNGVGTTLAVSSELGDQYNVDANTITSQQQPVEEITSVTNNLPAQGGQDMETDLDFRARIKLSAIANESPTINGQYTALANTNGVTMSKIVTNLTMSTDSEGNPPKTVHIYVDGGTDQDVVDTIFNNIGGGIATYGTQSGNVVDSAGVSHTIYFDRPTSVPIFAKITVTVSDSFDKSEGEDDIRLALEGYIEGLEMGSKVAVNQTYADLYAVDGVTYVNVQVGTDANSLSSNDIQLENYQIATIDDSNIEVDYG
ncbi:bacteriophage protein [Lentilactobacillus hilgardii DSM 20176 = ATCC 8290]|nr:bacteriophage protein [Lentilactobacillus hilgardii DSM 20176 = ATCC 8290]